MAGGSYSLAWPARSIFEDGACSGEGIIIYVLFYDGVGWKQRIYNWILLCCWPDGAARGRGSLAPTLPSTHSQNTSLNPCWHDTGEVLFPMFTNREQFTKRPLPLSPVELPIWYLDTWFVHQIPHVPYIFTFVTYSRGLKPHVSITNATTRYGTLSFWTMLYTPREPGGRLIELTNTPEIIDITQQLTNNYTKRAYLEWTRSATVK